MKLKAITGLLLWTGEQMPKSLIILRGLPGSGKSTWAKERAAQIREYGYSAEIHSADNFFTNENGEYNFEHPICLAESVFGMYLTF